MTDRPNILVVMSDEHDPAVTGCYGHGMVQTPNLDRLAEEGVVFDRAYCNSPMCLPSRMSFLTGQYCHRIGAWDNGCPLRAEIPTFAHYFEAAGYETVLCGRMHMVGSDRLHGFGRRLFDDMSRWQSLRRGPKRTPEARRGSNSHVTECEPGTGSWQDYDARVTDLAVRFLRSRAEHPADRPWLLVSGLMFPHFPLIAPPAYFDLYDPSAMPLPDLQGETLADQHPAIQHLRYFFHNEAEVSEEITRRALASLVSSVGVTVTLISRAMARATSLCSASTSRRSRS